MNSKSITDLLYFLGMNDRYKGFHELAAALYLLNNDEDLLVSISSHLFVIVSDQFHVTVNSVNHNISRVIRICWNNAESREKLLQISPVHLDSRPTVCEFLDILYWVMKNWEADRK